MNKYERYKKVNLPWLKEIPNHWCIDKTKRFSENKKEINKGNRERNILSLTLKGVVKNNIENPNGLTPESYETYQIFEKNDLVFKLIDLENIKTSRVGIVEENGIMSSAYIRLVFGSSIYPKYVYYYFFKLYIEQVYNNLGSGVRSTMNSDDLRDILLPIPPIKEQVQIANYLDWKINEIDRLIQIEKEKIKQLDYKKQVSISIEYKKITEQRRLKMLLLEPLLYGINGVGKEKGKIRFVRITDIDSCGKLKNEKKLYIDDCEDKFLLKCGDILFARSGATVGKSYMHVNNNGLMSFAGYLIRARLDNKLVIPKFVYLYLQSEYYELWKKSVFIQSTIQNISAEKYSNLLIPIADKETQHKTIQIVNKIINSVENNKTIVFKKITELELLKQSLISEVVTGQIDVRDIAIPEYEKVAIADGEIEETDEMEGKEYGN